MQTRTRRRVMVVAACAFGGGCTDANRISEPELPTRPRATANAQSLDVTLDTVAVVVQDTMESPDSVTVKSANGTPGWKSGGGSFLEVPKNRPSVVYAVRASTSDLVGWNVIGAQQMAAKSVTVSDQTSLEATVMMHPMKMPRSLAGVDSLRAFAFSGITPQPAASEYIQAVRAGAFNNGPDHVSLPQSVNTYLRQVGERYGAAVLQRRASDSVDNTSAGTAPMSNVPWVTILPATGGAGTRLEAATDRGDHSLRIRYSTVRAFAVSVYVPTTNGGVRYLADDVIVGSRMRFTTSERATSVALANMGGEETEDIPVPSAAALRYWGPDSSFRVRVLLASRAPGATLSEHDKTVASEMAKQTLIDGLGGFAENVVFDHALAKAAVKFGVEGQAMFECVLQQTANVFDTIDEWAETFGSWFGGGPAGFRDAESKMTAHVVGVGTACSVPVAVGAFGMATGKVLATGVVALGKKVTFIINGMEASAPLDEAIESMFPVTPFPVTMDWGVKQTWMNSIEFRAADTTAALTQGFFPSTVGIPIIPMARLETSYKPLPPDGTVTASVPAGIGYNTTTRKMIAYNAGVGTVNASWITSPTGGRTTKSHAVTFCGIDSLKTVGTGPDTVTLVMDTVRFTHFVKNSCTQSWQPWTKVKMQATASPFGMKTGLTSTPSGNSINSISFTMPGSSARFTTEFYSSDWTYLNRRSGEKIYQPAQASIRNFNIDPKAVSLGTNQTATISITLGDIVDHYGNPRPYPVCLRRTGGQLPASCSSSIPVTGFETGTVNFTGYSPQIPYLMSATIGVRIN